MRETFINGPKRAFDCEVCLREFDTMKDLSTHAEFHFVPNFKCNKCSHGFKVRNFDTFPQLFKILIHSHKYENLETIPDDFFHF